MLQSSCSISTFGDCPSLFNWTHGMKLQNMRWERFSPFACEPIKEELSARSFQSQESQASLGIWVVSSHVNTQRSSCIFCLVTNLHETKSVCVLDSDSVCVFQWILSWSLWHTMTKFMYFLNKPVVVLVYKTLFFLLQINDFLNG